MALNGLCTDPNVAGTEKIVVTKLDDQWLSNPRVFLSAADIGVERGLLPPESCFMVKGWNRGVCAIIVMMAMTELVEFGRPVKLFKGLALVWSPHTMFDRKKPS